MACASRNGILSHDDKARLVRLVIRALFGQNRETSYMPTNDRSAKVLRRAGFAVVGYARDFLYINGAWRDHVLTALVDPKERAPGPTSGPG